jgi:glycosyltransferase involved in cell wall biosynthesis
MLSILMPLDSHTSYLEESLNSIQNALSRIECESELLVVLNGATIEDTHKITTTLSRFQLQSRILTLRDRDLVSALNFGLKEAQYDFVARMDGDDVCLPERFSTQIRYLNVRKDLVAVGGQALLIDEFGSEFGNTHYPKDVNRFLKFGNQIAHSAVMFRRSIVLSINGYSKKYPFAEDYDLWCRLIEKGNVENLRSTVIKYRVHQYQVSSSNLMRQLSSTILIMARFYEINISFLEIQLDFLFSNLPIVAEWDLLTLSIMKTNQEFTNAVALMILRRTKGRTLRSHANAIYNLFKTYKFSLKIIIEVLSESISMRCHYFKQRY